MTAEDRPLEGTKALTLLAKYAGLSDKNRVYELAEIINMIEEYPGAQLGNEKYDAFPKAQANREFRERVLPWLHERTQADVCTIVFLGAAARDVVAKQTILKADNWSTTVHSPEWFVPHHISELELGHFVYFSPHPGGTSMWWNKPGNKRTGMAFWHRRFAEVDTASRTTSTLPEQSQARVAMHNTPRM